MDLTNGGMRETEQELYTSPLLPTQLTQVAGGGDHHYYYIDAAYIGSDGHSDSTVLYDNPTFPSYGVCMCLYFRTVTSRVPCMGRQIVVVLSLLHVVKLFNNTTFALVQSQVYSTGGVFNSIGILVPTEVKGNSYICIQYTNTCHVFHRRRELFLRVAMK